MPDPLSEGITPTAILRAVFVLAVWLIASYYFPDA